jgi:hypothetical protein
MTLVSGSLKRRAEVSTKPPGGLGTTKVMARSGKACALANWVTAVKASAVNNLWAMWNLVIMVS